jgi:hypothetical protein
MEPVTKRIFQTVLSVCVGFSMAHAQDADPDFKKEQRFHSIYKKYNEQPTSAEAWEKALANRKASAYTIQKNDTLWDVSQTFFGDSNYWPKVWSYNTEGILNPHQINPDQSIRFYAGTLEEPPTVGIAEKNTPLEEPPEQVLEKHEDGVVEAVKIPPPKKKSRPLVRHLPDSMPLYRLGAVNTAPVDFTPGRAKQIPTPQRYLSVYAVDQAVNPVGEVIEIETPGIDSASEFQYITVRLADPSAKHLVAYNDGHRVKDPNSLFASADLMEIQGEIEVLEKVSGSGNIYRAFVQKTVDHVQRGAKLMPGSMQMFEVKMGAPTTSVQARIIGGEAPRYQQIFGDDDFIFLSAGAKEGLQEGSTLKVYMNERARKSTNSEINDRVIGYVKIVKLADHFATAFVLKSEMQFVVGDYVGGTVQAASSAPESGGDELEKELGGSGGEAPAVDPALTPDSGGDAGGASDDLAL